MNEANLSGAQESACPPGRVAGPRAVAVWAVCCRAGVPTPAKQTGSVTPCQRGRHYNRIAAPQNVISYGGGRPCPQGRPIMAASRNPRGNTKMVTTYASDVTHWERWQREYRFGVLLIYPPEPPFQQVNALRAEHDPRSQCVGQERASCLATVTRTSASRFRSRKRSLKLTGPSSSRSPPASHPYRSTTVLS
jgi:hypothetical protein